MTESPSINEDFSLKPASDVYLLFVYLRNLGLFTEFGFIYGIWVYLRDLGLFTEFGSMRINLNIILTSKCWWLFLIDD